MEVGNYFSCVTLDRITKEEKCIVPTIRFRNVDMLLPYSSIKGNNLHQLRPEIFFPSLLTIISNCLNVPIMHMTYLSCEVNGTF